MKARALGAFMAALAAVSCGAPLMKLPTGPGTLISEQEAFATLAEATTGCNGIQALTAEVGVRGSAGGHRMRGRLIAGVALPESVRLEAVAPFGPPLFVFVAEGGHASLLLPRDRRVLTDAPPQELLDAVAGVPLNATDVFTTLTGCPQAYSSMSGVAYGDRWRVIRASGGAGWKTLYLQREGAGRPWRLAAVARDEADWRVEYPNHRSHPPQSIHLKSGSKAAGSARFDITLTLSQVETNAFLDPNAFTIQIPADAEPITLEEVRRSGPLAQTSNGR